MVLTPPSTSQSVSSSSTRNADRSIPRTSTSTMHQQRDDTVRREPGPILSKSIHKHAEQNLAAAASADFNKAKANSRRNKYKRKRIPETEKKLKSLKKERQKEYERILQSALSKGAAAPSIWSFESLFPDPVLDKETVDRDLYENKKRDMEISSSSPANRKTNGASRAQALSLRINNRYSSSPVTELLRDPKEQPRQQLEAENESGVSLPVGTNTTVESADKTPSEPIEITAEEETESKQSEGNVTRIGNATSRVDFDLTRMVEDRMFGYRRTQTGTFQYDTSLMGDGAVKFREGVRLGNPLKVNADRLNYLAKKEMQHGRVEEAQELYESAVEIDPRDGRAYLGLSRCAQRRRDFKLAREYLKLGIANSVAQRGEMEDIDRGANPFLTQALGCLEERMGRLSEAEALYIASVKSRPSHAAAWVALAQLRTRKLGQTANSGRICYQNAEKELKKAGLPASAYVYTAWAGMEYKKAGDYRRARELFKAALEVDPNCSAAWLQLGVMEADRENWKDAQECFEAVLKFDQRNSRVLQAYALMESKRPHGQSRKAIDLFERALRANPRDAGVLQAYALYVADLGDIDAARDLLRRGTAVNKRHAPVWQAWGVLETRYGTAEEARNIFQQGIWACAQLSGSRSGGYPCARLWQAWGVLEARENDPAAARRCFSRALDADSRNVPAITAWTHMEEELGNIADARSIFENALPKFAPGSEEKVSLWRSYELMEQRLGNLSASQQVYQRSMREAMSMTEPVDVSPPRGGTNRVNGEGSSKDQAEQSFRRENEVEVVRWDGGGGEVWLNDRAIEGKVPFSMRNRKRNS